MKDLILGFKVFIIVLLLLYLAIAFVQWSLNPSNWSELARVCCVMFALPVGVMAALIVIQEYGE